METREEKSARMAAALRANLRKRKQQARGEPAAGDATPAQSAGADGVAPPPPEE